MDVDNEGTGAEQRERRGARHSRDDVIAAAVQLLDHSGLPDLTMRRLATTLGVQPSALYWHFENKQSLLAAVSDWITRDRPERDQLRTAFVQARPGWTSALRAEALWLRCALLDHRDGAEIVASTVALGLGHGIPMRHLEKSVRDGGFDDQTAQASAAALLHFVLGSTQHEQQRDQAGELGLDVPAAPRVEHRIGDGAFAAADLDAFGAMVVDSVPGDFAFGVDLLVDGLAARRSGADQESRRIR
ncbi:MAG: TetR family transcriptional regulator [Pseudoclavibacter sp.]